MRYANAIFDVDGTIFDSFEGVRKSLAYTYAAMGLPVPEEAVLRTFLGPSLHDSFGRVSGWDKSTRDRAIALFRSVYSTENFKLAAFNPGIETLIARLRAAGVKVTVASSKPYTELIRLFEHKGIVDWFDRICAPGSEAETSDKTELVKSAAAIGSPAVMIGDRKFDLLAAKKAGVDSIAVTFGFGTLAELEACRPTYTADSAGQIEAIVLGSNK